MTFKSVVFTMLLVCITAGSTGQSQQFVSSSRVSPPSPFLTSGLFPYRPIYGVADFNSDGRLDFVISTLNQAGTAGIAALMLQNSDGTFTEKQLPSVPLGATVVADVNGDGKADIVTALPGPADDHGGPLGPATLTIALGKGDGTFIVLAPINLAGGVLQPWVLVRDLNRDNKPDLIVVSGDQYGDAILQTFLNNGGGSFRAGATYPGSLIGGNLLAVGDFNGDGNSDLVVKNNFETQILLGKGDGSFSPGATYNLNAAYVGVGDFNRDHHQDLVVVTAQNSKIMLGKGDGTFAFSGTLDTTLDVVVPDNQFGIAVQPTGVYVGDLNKDGILDVAVTTASSTVAVSVFYGKGNGTFTNPKTFNIGGVFGSVGGSSAFADFNRDGRIDVLALSAAAGFTIAHGTNDGGFDAPVISQAPKSGSIAKGDFNGDGIDDIAVVDEPVCSNCTGTSVRVFLGTGKGYFKTPVTYPIPVRVGAIAAGDVNGDGKMDLVVARKAQSINYPYSALARVASLPNLTVKPLPAALAAAASTTPDVSVLIGRGDGTFETPKNYQLLGAPAADAFSSSAYLIDVNHDGKLDLVGDWGTALGKGNGEFATPIPLPSSLHGIVALAPGDFSASGKVDLAVATNTYNAVSPSFSTPAYVNVLSGDGKGSFQISRRKSVGILQTLITADLNGDGLSDILYMTSETQGTTNFTRLSVDLSKGQGAFSTATYNFPSSFLATDIVTGDFNRDGKTDVVILSLFANGGDLALLPGTGGGALNKTPQYYQGSLGSAVVLDMNGDGAPDIAGTTTIGVARLLNTGHK